MGWEGIIIITTVLLPATTLIRMVMGVAVMTMKLTVLWTQHLFLRFVLEAAAPHNIYENPE